MTMKLNNNLITTLNEYTQPLADLLSKADLDANHIVALFAIYCLHDIIDSSIKEKMPLKTRLDLKNGEFEINVN